ncbi:MAG TPA: PTS sugar transporter subunit IIC [Gemmatimonadaceae bacterium]|nr:PTS sugar transporter subunit IIC [Gemmatimonadaceae bacterium]
MTEALFPLALLGALLGLDTVSFPQAMLSRPLVAATLGGAMAGSPMDGLLIGAALELIALETLPFGASRYPEWGSASMVGGALFASAHAQPAGSSALAIIAALATAWIGGWTMVKLRQLNARWAAQSQPALDAGARGAVIGLQLKCMTADLVRGFLLTIAALIVFAPLTEASLALWSLDARTSRAVAVAVATSVAAGAAWKLFHGSTPAKWTFVAGLGAGLTMMVTR